MIRQIELHAIHGFLGLPTDWHVFNLPELYAYDLNNSLIQPSSDGFWGWAQRFNQQTVVNNGLLMGYSLGGRLGMHALLDNPTLWKGGILISSHTGCKNEKEKAQCLETDMKWAERFENEPWDTLVEAWNQRPIFSGFDFPIPRKEHQFERKKLAHLLRTCSRAHQDDLSKPLQNFELPILWICGKQDLSYVNAARHLEFSHPLSRVEIVEGAGHRVPWEQPQAFVKLIQSFINEVSSCL